MKKKWTRILAAIASMLCVLAALQLLAGAEETCRLTVWPCAVNTEEDIAIDHDLMITDDDKYPKLRYDLYKVAAMERSSTSDTYDFVKISEFPDIDIPEMIESSAVWDSIAQEAAKTIFLDEAGRVKEALTVTPVKSNVPLGDELTDLEPGLYLIVPHAVDASHTDYLDTQKDGKLITRFQGEKNRYTFLPELITLPTKAAVDGEVNTANPGSWEYEVKVYLKPGIENEIGKLQINKTLLSYGNDSPVTFIFHVKAEKGGKTVYDKIVSMDFTKDTTEGPQSILLTDLPVGATVTVEEIYHGASCKLIEEVKPTDSTVSADTVLEFSFTNDFDNTNKGHGILNRFVFINGEWQVNPSEGPEGGETP